jgi:hypothetical protein
MKKGLKVLICFSLLFVAGTFAFAQPSSRSIETIVLDDFDSANGQNYMYNGEPLSWDWTVGTSRFVAEGFPKYSYYDGVPNSLKQLLKGTDKEFKVFGVKVAYNRKGDNWFEVYPTKDGKNYEIPFIGTVSQVDFWVWGANYLYFLDMLVRDGDGRVHILPAGSLNFNGWKNVVVNIPGWMNQHSKLRSGRSSMSFVGFRIRSDAEEYVDDYVIFFDQIKYTTNSLAVIYDGYELRDIDFGDAQSSSDTVEE